jgi:trehalose-6-phosphatase
MAELTTLDEKVGEVIGLAMAARGATDKVKKLVDDEELARQLEQTHDEAAQIEKRCTELVSTFEGKKTAILEKARETRQEAAEMMSTYLGDDADGLDGFEFLTMAEAGELGHWSVVAKLNEKARHPGLQEVTDWALPLQEKHLRKALDGSLKLASEEDPSQPA